MSAWAKPGVKCVCRPTYGLTSAGSVNAKYPSPNFPQAGGVYTIRAVVVNSVSGEMLLLLEEVINRSGPWGKEPGFGVRHFRPLAYPPQSLEADLAKFREIATQAPLPAKEPVA